jgi:hypothetical protein
MKKTQKCLGGPKRGHFQQPEQQIEFLHLIRKTDVSITYQAMQHDGQKHVHYQSHSIVSGPAQADVNIMMWREEFSSCRRFILPQIAKRL